MTARATLRRPPLGRQAAAICALLLGSSLLALAMFDRSPVPSENLRVGPDRRVTAVNEDANTANNSPTLLADPADPRFVVLAHRLDAPDFSCALQLSGDGGRTWRPADPVPKLPVGAEKCYAPEVAFDRSGVLYYLFLGLAGGGNEPVGAFLTTSADRGRTFTSPRQVLGPLNFAVRMAIDPTMGERGRIHLVWLHAGSDPPLGGFGPPPNPILAAHSDDEGRTFSKPVLVNEPDRTRLVAPALALGPHHRVHVVYYDLRDDAVDYQGLEGPVWDQTWSLVVATSSDGGRHFRQGVVAEPAVVPFERVMLIFTMAPPSLVVRGDRLCLAWGDGRSGDADILLRCSTDAGRRWTASRRLNDDSVGNGRSQLMPRLAFSPGGRLDAVFYDRRDDPNDELNAVYYTHSGEGEDHFSPNVKLTSATSFSGIGQQYANDSAEGLVEFGNRMALLSRDEKVVAAWADTRNSRVGTRAQDVFSTVLDLPPSSGDRDSLKLIGVLVMTAGMVALVAGRLRLPAPPTGPPVTELLTRHP